MFDVKNFGERLTAIRQQRNLSQVSVSKTMGITQTQLSDMENGKTGTTLPRLVKLAEFYHVSTDYLLGITDDPTWRGIEPGSDEGNAGFEAGTTTDRGTM